MKKSNSTTAEKKVLDSSDSYKIDKTTAIIERVFCDSNAKTLDEILLNLMKKDAENP